MAHPASPRGAPELNYNIKSVFDSQANTLPMCCFRRGRLELLKAEQPQLQPPPPPVDDAMAQRLVSALASVGHGDTIAADAVTDPVTILQFRRKSESEQLAFIDAIWNAISIPEPFTTPLSKMMDPVAGSVDGTGPLPSSLCPTQPGAATFQQRVPGQTFRKYGVGFRVEGSSLKDVIRLTNDGFNQQRFNFGFMCGVRGLRIDRTIIARQTSMARLWTGNHDTFNETAVCVSRNFFGATAFPLRTSDAYITCGPWTVETYSAAMWSSSSWD
jgi:hypothetical protein